MEVLDSKDFSIVEAAAGNAPADRQPGRQKINPAILYLLTLGSTQSRLKMRRTLNRFARMFGFDSLEDFPWEQLRSHHLTAAKSQLELQGRAPATVNHLLCALRGVAHQAWGEELISDHDEKVISAVKGSHGLRLGAGRALNSLETSRLVSNCDNRGDPAGIRDAAILAIGIGCGLRRNEIATLQLESIRSDGTFSVIGKGNRERRIFPPEAVAARLAEWLRIRGTGGCGNVFVAVLKGGRVCADMPLSSMAIWKVIERRAREVNIAHFSPHDLRRTFATRMLDLGADLDTIKEAMGHSSVTTTQRYVKNTDERVRRYASRIAI